MGRSYKPHLTHVLAAASTQEFRVGANKISTDFLGGYRRERSTTDTICALVGDILKQRNVGRFSLAYFIDIKKAFDSVNFGILQDKLDKY